MNVFRIVAIWILFLTGIAFGQAPVDLSGALAKFNDSQVILRKGLIGKELYFDTAGNPIRSAQPAPVMLNGFILITTAKLRGDLIQFEGRRLQVYYLDSNGELRTALTGEKVTVFVKSEMEPWSEALLSKVLPFIFRPIGDFQQSAANYYKFLASDKKGLEEAKNKGQPVAVLEDERLVYRIDPKAPKEFVLPKVTKHVDPEYSEDAKAKKQQGTTMWQVVVNEEGLPEILVLEKSLSDSLDQSAALAIRKWRFKPATRNGNPVAVHINVEVNFHLY